MSWAQRIRHVGAARPPWRKAVTIGLVLLVAATVVVVGLARLRSDTGPKSFLPAGDPTLLGLHEVASSFGGDPIVVLLEAAEPRQLLAGDRLTRLVGLEGELALLPDVAAVYGPGTILNQIARGAKNFIASLAGHRDRLQAAAAEKARADGLSDAEVRAAATEAVASFDRRYASLLVRGLPAGLPTLRNSEFVDQVVFGPDGQPKPSFRYVVPNTSAVAILVRPRQDLDQAATERLVAAVRGVVDQSGVDATRVTVTGVPAVATGLGERLRQEIPLLGGFAVLLVAACYLFVPWARGRRVRLLPVAATLGATTLTLALFGWLDRPLSLGVITFLPILIGIGSDFPAYLVQGARRRRVVVTACASAAGFASLALSPLPFVRDLGLALATGTLIAVGLGLLIRRRLDRRGAVDAGAGPPAPSVEPRARRMTRPAAGGALVVAGLVAAAGWAALPHLDVEARPDQLAAGLPAVVEARHAEQVLGSSGEIRVLVRGEDVRTPALLEWSREAVAALVVGYGDEVRPIITPSSLLEFLGPTPTQEELAAGVATLPDYLVNSVIRPDGERAVLSFGVELQDLEDQVVLLDGIRAALPPAPPGMEVEVVGLPVAAAQGYEIVSDDRYLPNVLGIAAAGLVLAIGLRRRGDAVRAVAAAALATGWALAGAWLVGLSLSPLSVGLGSLAVATACEFSVLLAHGAARARMRRTVGVAALSAAMGYLALAASDLAVIREFGLLLAGVVVLSLLAAQLVQHLLPDADEYQPPGTGQTALEASAPQPTMGKV